MSLFLGGSERALRGSNTASPPTVRVTDTATRRRCSTPARSVSTTFHFADQRLSCKRHRESRALDPRVRLHETVPQRPASSLRRSSRLADTAR
jgi:hypothetical protein